LTDAPYVIEEVPDLTHAPTIKLFRRWDQKEVAFVQLLRFLRISSAEPHVVNVSRSGKHRSLVDPSAVAESTEMEVMEEGLETEAMRAPVGSLAVLPLPFADPPTQFASTMMTMDGPL
jgi:translation machinery-associated protein 16